MDIFQNIDRISHSVSLLVGISVYLCLGMYVHAYLSLTHIYNQLDSQNVEGIHSVSYYLIFYTHNTWGIYSHPEFIY